MRDATEPAGDDFVEFYTRPGCPISASLLRKLRRAGVHLRIHDIWRDAHDAAFVRSVAHGCETVPTIVVGDATFVAPSARSALTEIRTRTPHLVEAPTPSTVAGPLARWFRGKRRRGAT